MASCVAPVVKVDTEILVGTEIRNDIEMRFPSANKLMDVSARFFLLAKTMKEPI